LLLKCCCGKIETGKVLRRKFAEKDVEIVCVEIEMKWKWKWKPENICGDVA
jgi:hypothetical protein